VLKYWTHVKWSMNVPWCATCHHSSGKNLMIKINPMNFWFWKHKKNKNDTCPQASCLIFKHVSYFDYLYVIARKVAHKVQLHWIGMYVWTCILTPYIHVAYVMSHATTCPMQLVLCNYTNLQLHVSHATEFYTCNWILITCDSCKTQNF